MGSRPRGRGSQLRLARHSPHVGGERRVRRSQHARYREAALDAAELDEADVGQVLVPNLDVLLQIERRTRSVISAVADRRLRRGAPASPVPRTQRCSLAICLATLSTEPLNSLK
jgi:hypothetical protein